MQEALPEEIRQATSSSMFSKVACQDGIVNVFLQVILGLYCNYKQAEACKT